MQDSRDSPRTVASVLLPLSVLIGALAQLVDSTLGMAFGITSSTFLLLAGASPLAASASVHAAEIGTTLTSGFAHWRAGNIESRILVRLALPGALGAFLGAYLLAGVSLREARPLISTVLLLLGVLLLVRFGLGRHLLRRPGEQTSRRLLVPLGLLAGLVDATGGGGWGPIATPTLLAATSTEPRKVIGTVSASEFLVTVAAVAGFLTGAAFAGTNWTVVAGLLVGGSLIAPFSARLVRRADPGRFGVIVAGAVLAVNGDQLAQFLGAGVTVRLLWLSVVSGLVFVLDRRRRAAQVAAVHADDQLSPIHVHDSVRTRNGARDRSNGFSRSEPTCASSTEDPDGPPPSAGRAREV